MTELRIVISRTNDNAVIKHIVVDGDFKSGTRDMDEIALAEHVVDVLGKEMNVNPVF